MHRDAQVYEEISRAIAIENNTGCCIRTDQSGCVQTPPSDCSVGIWGEGDAYVMWCPAGLELDKWPPRPLLDLLGVGPDVLRLLSTFRAFFTTNWIWCLFVTLPNGLSAPPKNNNLIQGLLSSFQSMMYMVSGFMQ